MFTFLVIITSVAFVLLVFLASIRPRPSLISKTELERRSKQALREAKVALRREKLLPDVLVLLRVKITVLLVAVILLSVVTFGWLIGIIVAIIVALEYGVIARFPPLARVSLRLYESVEPRVLNSVEKFGGVVAIFRDGAVHENDPFHRFDSREELQQLIDESGDILSEDERLLIVHALGFKDQTVASIMTPKADMHTIKKTEFLGPLVLDELHLLGNTRLPVTSNGIDHIVGILNIKDLLTLDDKKSVTVERAMDPKVFYIRDDQSLDHALAAFLKARHHLFIVINKERETVGLVTLEDIMESLLGRKIYDEDDHQNAREVASAESEPKNLPKNHVDV